MKYRGLSESFKHFRGRYKEKGWETLPYMN